MQLPRKEKTVKLTTLLRNPEIKWSVGIYITFVCLATFTGSYIWGMKVGLFAFCMSGISIGIHLFFSIKRYNDLAQLADQLDEILHGNRRQLLREEQEGELSILKNEISKMVIRLQEQAEHLQEEKIFLADSIADISHQIRTPLTSITLVVSLLSEPKVTEERRGQLLRELKQLLKRIDWLINTLLKISKLDAGTIPLKSEKIEMTKLLQKAKEPLEISMELRGIQWNAVIEESMVFQGDFAWTLEAVENILKNCMEHTPEGGEIVVHAVENKIYTELTIEDNGEGVDEEDLPHIFERFYKGKNASKESIGIGLALAKTIMLSQNGTICAERRVEGGTRFILRFYHRW